MMSDNVSEAVRLRVASDIPDAAPAIQERLAEILTMNEGSDS